MQILSLCVVPGFQAIGSLTEQEEGRLLSCVVAHENLTADDELGGGDRAILTGAGDVPDLGVRLMDRYLPAIVSPCRLEEWKARVMIVGKMNPFM